MQCLGRLAAAWSLLWAAPRAQDLDAWDRALTSHVSFGVRQGIVVNAVDYSALQVDPNFKRFVKSLASAPTPNTSGEAYSLFMNAYNALAMKMVVDHGCPQGLRIASIGDIGRKKTQSDPDVWSMPAGVVAGKMYSLRQLEDYLRNPEPWHEDPRFHACLVCASISCPNLPLRAFRPNEVHAQMATQLDAMLSNRQKGFMLDKATRTVTLSKIFKWYETDFARQYGSILDFILPHLPSTSERAIIAADRSNIRLAYFPWNPDLNGPAPCLPMALPRRLENESLLV